MSRIVVVLGVLGVALAGPGVAAAKVPPFTIDVSPPTPVSGGTMTITVRFWVDAEHTTRSRWPDVRSLDDFLLVRGVGASAHRIPVDVERVRPGVFRGSFTLPTAGRWEVCPLSCGSRSLDLPGYADPVEILVAPSPPPQTWVGARAAPADGPAGSWYASSWMLAILAVAIPVGWTLATVARRR